MAQFSFDTSKVQNDYGLIPKHEVIGHIVSSDSKISSAGGEYINFKLEILEGRYAKRLLWKIVMTHSESDTAVKAGVNTMIQICNACRIPAIQSTSELHNIPIRFLVGIEEGKNGHPDKNCILKFLPIDKTAPLKPIAFQKPETTTGTWKPTAEQGLPDVHTDDLPY